MPITEANLISMGGVKLPGMSDVGYRKHPDTVKTNQPAINFRRDMLFYFSKCEIGLPDFCFKSRKRMGAEGGYNTYEVASSAGDAKSGTPPPATISAMVNSALQSVQADGPAWLSSAANSAVQAIQAQLPAVISGIIAEVGKFNVPMAKDTKAMVKNLAKGISKTHTYWKSRGLNDAIRSGEPAIIVGALRREIGTDAVMALGQALYAAAKLVVQALTVGAGTIAAALIDSIAGFLGFIWDLYKKARDYFALQRFFKECNTYFTEKSNIISDDTAFNRWLSDWIGEMPIIASHCIGSPFMGSYFNFLNSLTDDKIPDAPAADPNAGRWASFKSAVKAKVNGPPQSQLQIAYGKYESLKEPARDYIKEYYHRFSSDQKLVAMSLRLVQVGFIDKTGGGAYKSLSWPRRKYYKYFASDNPYVIH